MKYYLLIISIPLFIMNVSAQDTKITASKHFETVPAYPETFTVGTALARIVDGLGFRYYWGTHDLTSEDLAYRPSDEARSSLETLSHIDYMLLFVENTVKGEVTSFPEPEMNKSYEEIRSNTLQRIESISSTLKSLDDESIGNLTLKLTVGSDDMQAPFWHLLQGPIGDAYYHLGQVVSFRRTTGNPIDPTVQPFMGKRVTP